MILHPPKSLSFPNHIFEKKKKNRVSLSEMLAIISTSHFDLAIICISQYKLHLSAVPRSYFFLIPHISLVLLMLN